MRWHSLPLESEGVTYAMTCVESPCLASVIFSGLRGLRSDVCQASGRGLDDATGGSCCSNGGVHIGSESYKRSSPGLNVPAMNFEVRVAYSSSIARPGL
jgi:hypothetical protein